MFTFSAGGPDPIYVGKLDIPTGGLSEGSAEVNITNLPAGQKINELHLQPDRGFGNTNDFFVTVVDSELPITIGSDGSAQFAMRFKLVAPDGTSGNIAVSAMIAITP